MREATAPPAVLETGHLDLGDVFADLFGVKELGKLLLSGFVRDASHKYLDGLRFLRLRGFFNHLICS